MSVIKSLANACALLLAGASAVADPLGHETGEVDLQLVLAADRSGSMSRPLVEAQRNGFAAAFRTDELQNAILSGPLGRIAVVYFEWSDHSDQEVVVPWTILANADDIHHFARELERAAPPEKGGETSISGALYFAHRLLSSAGHLSRRTVVDVSSNGRNSEGPPVTEALGMLREMNATVNGLVLPEDDYDDLSPYAKLGFAYDGPLFDYFAREVIDGPGAFAIEVDPDTGFGPAILRKLVLEVAWAASPEDGN